MNAAWQQKEETRRHLRADLHNRNLRKAVKMALGKNIRKVRKAAVLSFFRDFAANSKHALEKATRPASTSI